MMETFLLLLLLVLNPSLGNEETVIFDTNTSSSSVTPKSALHNLPAICSKPNETCRSPAQCALYFTDETSLEQCSLQNAANDTEKLAGFCCSDVLTNRFQSSMPAEGPTDEEHDSEQLDNLSAADLAASSDEGSHFVEELKKVEKRIAQQSNLQLDQQSPEAGHLKFSKTSDKGARDQAMHALKLAATTKGLKTRLGLVDPDMELRQINVMGTRLGERCPPQPQCPVRLSKYRTFDGSCNNARRPWIGRALSPTQRLLHAHYEDGVQSPRLARDGGNLPSAREVSMILSVNGDRAPQDRKLSALVADFGQMIDHDLTQSPVFTLSGGGGIQCCERDGSGEQPVRLRHPQCMPIEIPRDDPFFARFRQRCMNFVRTMPALQHNCSLGAIHQMNAVSHWLDGSMLYGSNNQQARTLMGPRGTLRTSGTRGSELLPSQPNACTTRSQRDDPSFCFRAGDVRVNEQPMLVSLTTIFMREHNRVATSLSSIHRDWSDEALYHETRRIVIAELQHIAYNEFLPVLLGQKFMETYGLLPLTRNHSDDYNQNYDASITNEFSAAAYRLHTLVRGVLRFTDAQGSSQRLKLRETLNSPQVLFWPDAGDALIRGQTSRPLGAFDYIFTDELTDHMFQVGGPFGLDIFSLNIQRGRDHGLPGYNAYRKLCGLPRARSFEDLSDTVRPEAIPLLRTLYRNVEDIDLYVGGLSEKRSSGSLLGHTFLCLAGDQFARLKKGDRFFYDLLGQPSSFTLDQLTEIRKVSLARLICDNSPSITQIQPLVFWQREDLRNPLVSCDSLMIPRMDLRPWDREFPEI